VSRHRVALTPPTADVVADIVIAGQTRWTVRPWRHPRPAGTWLLTYTSAGHGRYRLGPTHQTVSVGDLMLARSEAPFEYATAGADGWTFLAVCFDPWSGWASPGPFVELAPGLLYAHVRLLRTRQRIEDAFRRLIADVRSRDGSATVARLRQQPAGRPDDRLDPRRVLALTALHEIATLVDADAYDVARLDPRIVGALQVITADLTDQHDVASLAHTAGLSASRFQRLFREQLGVPLRQAIRTLRLQDAALRLAYGNDSVGTIAEEVGLSSLFDLSRAFKRAYGVSPTAYREHFRTQRLPPRWPGASAQGG
jgi:AraC family transcriptional regulator, arabinose operon regulatory protein